MSSSTFHAHKGKSMIQSWNLSPQTPIIEPAFGLSCNLCEQNSLDALNDTTCCHSGSVPRTSPCFTPDLRESAEILLSPFQELQEAATNNKYHPKDDYLLRYSSMTELLVAELPPISALAQQDFCNSLGHETVLQTMNTCSSGLKTESKSQHEPNRRRPMKKGTSAYREAHIHSERQRRRGMSSLFSTLQSLLPAAHAKWDRCTTLTYVIEYVQQLQETLQHLGQKRAELVASTIRREATRKVRSEFEIGSKYHNLRQWQSPPARWNLPSLPLDVSVRFWSSVDICITLNCAKKKGLWPELLAILEDQNVDVENVTVSTTADCCFHCIYGKVPDICEVSCEGLRAMLIQLVVAQLGVGYFY